MDIVVRPIVDADRPWLAGRVVQLWGAEIVVSRGMVHRPAELPGFVAELGGTLAGIATYRIAGAECEVVTLDAIVANAGVGTLLLEAVRGAGRTAGCERLWLVTTNDNTPALRFYQRRGWKLAALYRGAVADARRLKPEIPETGLDGIPIRDEILLDFAMHGKTDEGTSKNPGEDSGG